MSSPPEKLEQISLYLAGELDEAERAELDSEIESCESLAGEVSFLRGFRGKLKEAEAHSLPAGVQSRLLESLKAEREKKVTTLEKSRKKQKANWKRNLWKYGAAAAVICVTGLGLIQSQYAPESPVAVASLVEHHDTCWHIQDSEGRNAQFQEWVDKLGGMPPTPRTSEELVAVDQRECPAGEVRAGHLMYQKEK